MVAPLAAVTTEAATELESPPMFGRVRVLVCWPAATLKIVDRTSVEIVTGIFEDYSQWLMIWCCCTVGPCEIGCGVQYDSQ